MEDTTAVTSNILLLPQDTALFASQVGKEEPMHILNTPVQFFSEVSSAISNAGLHGRLYNSSPEIVNAVSAMLIVMFVLLSLRFRTGYKFFRMQVHHLYAVKLRENMFEDHTTINEIFANVMSMVNSCICQGVLLFYMLLAMGLVSFHSEDLWVALAMSIAGTITLYLFQYIAYRLLGYTFAPSPQHSKIWVEGYTASQALMGMVMLPMIMALNLSSGTATGWLYGSLIIGIFMRIAYIIKGFRIFFTKLQQSLYFILYLCTVEIIPLLVVWVLTSANCKHIIQ